MFMYMCTCMCICTCMCVHVCVSAPVVAVNLLDTERANPVRMGPSVGISELQLIESQVLDIKLEDSGILAPGRKRDLGL